MDFSWAFIYGFIQGVTEFLPISSSGHLALIPFFFKLEDPGVVFDLVMHLGTALAVIIYFNKEVLRVIRELIAIVAKRDFENTAFTQNFIISTFFSFVLILLIKNLAFMYGRDPLVIGINFIIFGLLMYLADKKLSKNIDLIEQKNFKYSALIGLAQSLAVFPGVSRSGMTLTMGRYLGLGRVEASRFSFMLSLPVIVGSIIFKIPDILSGSAMNVDTAIMLWGILFSFIFGIITIHFFMKLIAKIGLKYFGFYRIIVGSILIYLSVS